MPILGKYLNIYTSLDKSSYWQKIFQYLIVHLGTNSKQNFVTAYNPISSKVQMFLLECYSFAVGLKPHL